MYRNRYRLSISRYDTTNIRWMLEDSNPYEFEQQVADMFTRLGYQEVTVTKKSGDVGADIIMKRNGIKYVVQVKKYSEENKIGSPDLQRVQGSAQHYHAQGMIFVTYGFFSSVAIDYAKQHGIETIDHNELFKLMSKKPERSNGIFPSRRIKLASIMSIIIVFGLASGIIIYSIADSVGLNYRMSDDIDDEQEGDGVGNSTEAPDGENDDVSEDGQDDTSPPEDEEYIEGTIISVEELKNNPEKYADKNVIINALVGKIYYDYDAITIEDYKGGKSIFFSLPGDMDTSIFEPLRSNGYYWSGKIIIEYNADVGIYEIGFQVTNIQPVDDEIEENLYFQGTDEDTTSISELKNNLEYYVDKTVIIKASYISSHTNNDWTLYRIDDGAEKMGAMVYYEYELSVLRIKSVDTFYWSGTIRKASYNGVWEPQLLTELIQI